jgi:hypothetical protein
MQIYTSLVQMVAKFNYTYLSTVLNICVIQITGCTTWKEWNLYIYTDKWIIYLRKKPQLILCSVVEGSTYLVGGQTIR